MNSQGPQERSITEAAADWAVRLHAGRLSAAEQVELEQWQARDSRHGPALRFAEQTWAALGELRLELDGGKPARRAAPVIAPEPARQVSRRRRKGRLAASAAALLLALGVGWLQGPQVMLRMQSDYLTAKGEIRTVQLADGSRVELDSASAISLDFTGQQRQVHLLAGSAVFDVAPMGAQETRPFVVQSAGGQTRALGTQFVVGRESDQQAWVGVLQHSVAVSVQAHVPKGLGQQRVLEEGQSARYNPQDGVVALDNVDLQRATSWRRGVLVFDRLPLADVVEQLNRYRPGRVLLTNSELAERQVSGVFRLDMLDAALSTLTQELQVQRFDLAGVSLIY